MSADYSQGVTLCENCGAALTTHVLGGLCPRCAAVGSLKDLWGSSDEASSTIADGDPEPESTAGLRVHYFGDYELFEEAGRGGRGIVYKARQISLNRVVAVKLLSPEYASSASELARFEREAKAAASLDHPHVLPLYEIGMHDGHAYYSMKWVEGGSLAHQIHGGYWAFKKEPPGDRLQAFDQAQIAWLVECIALAVACAHECGVIHRDLKPANILVEPNGHAYVADFGLAKVPDLSSAVAITQSLAIVGTPAYIAPEILKGGARYTTPSCDIYGLGCILYELISGRPPFDGETPVEVLKNVADRDPVRPGAIRGGVERDLERICLKCLEKDPEHRYGTAMELSKELRRFIDGVPILARPGRIHGRIWNGTFRQSFAVRLAVVFSLLLGIVWMGGFAIPGLRPNPSDIPPEGSSNRMASAGSSPYLPEFLRNERGRIQFKNAQFVCSYPKSWKVKKSSRRRVGISQVDFLGPQARIRVEVFPQNMFLTNRIGRRTSPSELRSELINQLNRVVIEKGGIPVRSHWTDVAGSPASETAYWAQENRQRVRRRTTVLMPADELHVLTLTCFNLESYPLLADQFDGFLADYMPATVIEEAEYVDKMLEKFTRNMTNR